MKINLSIDIEKTILEKNKEHGWKNSKFTKIKVAIRHIY